MVEEKKAQTRVKIEDLPENLPVSEEDLKRVVGGWSLKTIVGTIWSKVPGDWGGGDCSTGSGSSGVRG